MGLWKKQAAVEPEVVVEAARSLAGTPYKGDAGVIFREGWFYPLRFDQDGNELGPDTDKPLVWRDGGYHHALPEDPNHFHRYGLLEAPIEQVA